MIFSATSRAQDLYVGSNAANVTTNFTSGTNNFYDTYVGYTTDATNNLLSVSGAGTVLTNTNDLHVGYLGSSNRLVVSNGAQVFSRVVYLGYGALVQPWLYASNNSMLVTGTNSRLTVRGLEIGYQGSGSSLVISNGGQVSSTNLVRIGPYANGNSLLVTGPGSSLLASVQIGDGIDGLSYNNSLVVSNGGVITGTNHAVTGGSYIGFSSSNNNVLITGNGSVWTESGVLSIGSFAFGTNNRLVISNGGTVTTAGGIIGVGGYTFQATLTGNAANSVRVTGTNSRWTSTGQLVVGQNSDGNSLTISDGGSVVCGTNLFINQYYQNTNGDYAGSLVLVQSGLLSVTNGQIKFGAGKGILQVDGGTVEVKELLATTPITPAGQILPAERRGSYVLLNGGTIISGSTTISNETGKSDNRTFYIGGNTGSGATFMAKGGTHTFWANLAVGDAGSSNSLVITNGAEVFLRPRPDSNHGPSGGTNLVIGVAAGASKNSVSISSGRLVITNGTLEIGRAGSGALNVTGGTVEVKTLLATNGANSVINFNGGTIISESSTISNVANFVVGDTGGSATFIAKGGAHSFASNMVVGNSGSGNSLVISNGGSVANNVGSIGFAANSSNNSALVTGTNSLWTNSGVFRVGESGSGNSLVISNGGKVANTEGSIGYNGVSSNNSALVTGANSVWTNSGYFYAGAYGSSNRLVVSNGGTVAALISQIGTFGSSLNNSVLVTGTNSLFNNALYLFIGGLGNSGNSMVISNGGLVTVGIHSYIGGDVPADNNSVLVTGAGSRWSNAFGLYVGNAGLSNSLTVANGGTASAGSGITIAASNGSVATLNIGRFGTNDTAGTITAPTIAFGAGTGVVNFNQSNSTTLSADISGNGTVNQLGTGTTTLSGVNTYTGGTAVSAGSLVGTTTSLQGAITNNAAVTFDQSTAGTYSGAMSGSGSLTKAGAGTVILTASNSYGGGTLLNAGALAAGNAFAFGTGSITLTNSTVLNLSNFSIANLIINNGGILTNVGTVSGAELNAGTTTLSANNSTVAEVSGTAAVTVAGNNTTITNVLGGTVSVAGTNTTVQNLTGGTVNVSAASATIRSFNGGNVAVGSGLSVAINDGTSSGVISGNGGITKNSSGVLTLGGVSTYSGATTVSDGNLVVNGSISVSAVTVQSGAALSGSGAVGAISGAGSLNPGNSPGILTATSVDPGSGLSFNFEFTSLNPTYSNATASVNDLLRLTDTTPFVASLNSANAVNLYFNVATFEEGQIYTGGFFTDAQADFMAQIVNATFTTYVADSEGTIIYGGQSYSLLGSGLSVTFSTTNQSANFAGGRVNGRVMQVQAVPEPSTYVLLLLAGAGSAFMRWRRLSKDS